MIMRDRMSIADWPHHEQPRERLLNQGPEALTESELLAILLRHGAFGITAIELARSLLTKFDGLRGLLQCSPSVLCQYPGFGPAKYCQLQAAFELSRRCLQETLQRDHSLSNSQIVQKFIVSSLLKHHQEVFAALFLDNQYRLIKFEPLFYGTINNATIYPREIIKRALYYNAAALIIAHNHPSGIAEASQADILLTQTLKSALALVEIKLLDHFIIGDNQAISLAEKGMC
jgi:DNA repair protein RadC